MADSKAVSILHISDVHFGRPHVAAHVAAVEAFAASRPFDAIVVSGDVSQRAWPHEFRQARAFLERMRQHAPLLVVPGNHDTAWWYGILNVGIPPLIHWGYRTYISKDLEPTLKVPGITIAGLNSSPGIQLHTLTKRPRDLSVRGALKDSQFADAKRRFSQAPAGDLKVLVCHHNVVPGELSKRWGMTRHEHVLDMIADTGADVILSGHDHQEKAVVVERGGRSFVACTAGTLSNRSRGGRASAFMTVEATTSSIHVTPWMYVLAQGLFEASPPLDATRGAARA
jgi:3',5'-cyclic AMP phosphodiesterase CpdA